jgi:hypothetical protein
VIVVVGAAAYEPSPAGIGRAVGLAPEIAAAAAAAGSRVELVAKIGEDGAGEELLLALARASVGHLAVLRDPARATRLALPQPEGPEEDDEIPVPALLAEAEAAAVRPSAGDRPDLLPAPQLEPADLSLGLQYLRDYAIVVAVEPLAAGGAAVVAEVAAFTDATLIVVARPGTSIAPAYTRATVFEAPAEDPDGAFAGVIGRYAAALDQGIDPAEAFRAATGAGGWEPAAG